MAKYLSRNVIKGQLGINVVERAVLQMGHKWTQGSGNLDTGIDGEIELCDPNTHEAKNIVLRVQVKARKLIESETADTFDFTCAQKDLDYWLSGNAPVLLIVVDLQGRDAWWVSVKEHFRDPARRKSRKATFHKTRDRFSADAAQHLEALEGIAQAGAYFTPARVHEQLVSNLLTVKKSPGSLYAAETPHRDPADVARLLSDGQDRSSVRREWFLRDGFLYSIHNLREAPWPTVCDRGTVEELELSEWATAEDHATRAGFVRLLNQCLREHVYRMGMRWERDQRCFYFRASKDMSPIRRAYKSQLKQTSRAVFRAYRSGQDPTRIAYCRHVGFEPYFVRFDGVWYLEINPTYVFTKDGMEPHAFREEYQAKIKSIEGSGAVRGSVVMFAELLRGHDTLFGARYEHLDFGDLLTVDLDVGLNDDLWSQRDELQAPPHDDDVYLPFAE